MIVLPDAKTVCFRALTQAFNRFRKVDLVSHYDYAWTLCNDKIA